MIWVNDIINEADQVIVIWRQELFIQGVVLDLELALVEGPQLLGLVLGAAVDGRAVDE